MESATLRLEGKDSTPPLKPEGLGRKLSMSPRAIKAREKRLLLKSFKSSVLRADNA